MVNLATRPRLEADTSYHDFWDNFDYTRTNASAYNRRVEDDKAPWFSEYVRRQLEDMLYGSLDLYNDGLIVKPHSTSISRSGWTTGWRRASLR